MSQIKTLKHNSKPGDRFFMIPMESARIQETERPVNNRENLTAEDIIEFEIEKVVSYNAVAARPVSESKTAGRTLVVDMDRMSLFAYPEEGLEWKHQIEHKEDALIRFRGLYPDLDSAKEDLSTIAREIVDPDIELSEIGLSVTVEDNLSTHQQDEILSRVKGFDKYEFHYHTTFHMSLPGEVAFKPNYIAQKMTEARKDISDILKDIHNKKLAAFDAILTPGAIEEVNDTRDSDVMAHLFFDTMPDVDYREIEREGDMVTHIVEVSDSSRSVLGYVQIDEKEDKIIAASKTPFEGKPKIESSLGDIPEVEDARYFNAYNV